MQEINRVELKNKTKKNCSKINTFFFLFQKLFSFFGGFYIKMLFTNEEAFTIKGNEQKNIKNVYKLKKTMCLSKIFQKIIKEYKAFLYNITYEINT